MKKVILLLIICIGCAWFAQPPLVFKEKNELTVSQCDVPWFDFKEYIEIDDDMDLSKLHVYYELNKSLFDVEQGMNVVATYHGRKFMKRYPVILDDDILPQVNILRKLIIPENMTAKIEDYLSFTDQKKARILPHQSLADEKSGYYTIKQNGVEISEQFDTSEIGFHRINVYLDDARDNINEVTLFIKVIDFDDLYISGENYVDNIEVEGEENV